MHLLLTWMIKSLSISLFEMAWVELVTWLVDPLYLTRFKRFVWPSSASKFDPILLLQIIDVLWHWFSSVARNLSDITPVATLLPRWGKLLIVTSSFLAPSLLLYLIMINHVHLADFFFVVPFLRISMVSGLSWSPMIPTLWFLPHFPHFNITVVHFANSVVSIALVFGNWLLDVILVVLFFLVDFSAVILRNARSWSELLLCRSARRVIQSLFTVFIPGCYFSLRATFLIVWLNLAITLLISNWVLITFPMTLGWIGVSLLALCNLWSLLWFSGLYLPYHHPRWLWWSGYSLILILRAFWTCHWLLDILFCYAPTFWASITLILCATWRSLQLFGAISELEEPAHDFDYESILSLELSNSSSVVCLDNLY